MSLIRQTGLTHSKVGNLIHRTYKHTKDKDGYNEGFRQKYEMMEMHEDASKPTRFSDRPHGIKFSDKYSPDLDIIAKSKYLKGFDKNDEEVTFTIMEYLRELFFLIEYR